MYVAFNYVTELEKLARGGRSKVDMKTLAEFALMAVGNYVPRKPRRKKRNRGRDVQFLEALYALPDPRG
jgi:hypothetical protein